MKLVISMYKQYSHEAMELVIEGMPVVGISIVSTHANPYPIMRTSERLNGWLWPLRTALPGPYANNPSSSPHSNLRSNPSSLHGDVCF